MPTKYMEYEEVIPSSIYLYVHSYGQSLSLSHLGYVHGQSILSSSTQLLTCYIFITLL